MQIWLSVAWFSLLKIGFSYQLKSLSFSLSKLFPRYHQYTLRSFTLVHPQVLLRSWSDEILDSFHVLMLKLSITMDLAKYLDSSICRGCALSPQALIFTKTGPFRSLPLDQNGRAPNLSFPYHQLSIWLSYCNLYDPGRAHNAKWLHLKLLNI